MIKRYSIYKNKILQDERTKRFKFNVDNRNYYVYRITNLTSLKHYYGSRIQKLSNIIDDFWSYGTSSIEKNNILLNPSNYKLKIINTFNNYNDCIIYESYLHQYFDVGYNDMFFNKSKQTPFDFIPDRRGMINCLTIDNVSCYITSEEYRNNKNLYKSYASDKITVMRISDINSSNPNSISITTKEFYSNRHLYKTIMEGTTHSNTTKAKMSESAKNRNKHPRTKKIIILDHNLKIIHTIKGNFKTFCIENNLPFTALKTSYQNNNEPIYTTSSNPIKLKANNKGWFPYFGWSAKEIY